MDMRMLKAPVLIAIAVIVFAQPPSTPSTPQACAGGVTILLNGSPLSSGCVLNLQAGTGVIAQPAADPSIGGTDIVFSVNTALVSTHPSVQNNELLCASANGTTAYTCLMTTSALTAYQKGQTFLLLVDTTCSSSCTLSINNVTATPVSVKQADGVTDPTGTLVAGQARWIWYDGTIFRLM